LLFPFFQQFGISLATTRNPQFFLVSIDFRWLYPIKKKPGFASAVQDLNSSSRDLEPLRREVHLSDDELWRAALQDNSCDICATYFLFFPSLLVRFCCPVLSHGFWGTNRSGLRGVHSILRIKHCVWFLPRGTLW
jgi:hypothetical protein